MATVKLSVDDPEFVEKIIFEVKSQGHFDSFRKACLADVDTQPAYQNLHSRVEDSVQKFLNRQVWTPETNKNKLREEMRYSIIRAGYLESGVGRIVDQVMEQKMNSIQLKVEEILYEYVGMDKPIKKEKQPNGSLEVDTDLLPTDLEQVSPDSDKKSSLSDEINMEIKDEQIEEEVIEDEDFESPAFEPVEPMAVDKNENSNLSAISGLTSQDSAENKSEPQEQEQQIQQDTQLSQISSVQDISLEPSESIPPPPGEELEIPPLPAEEPQEKSQFDLNKDSIAFTGNERKSITLDDSTNSAEGEKEKEKALQPQDVPSNTMEIDNLYENDTTDSSEMRMEIDLKMDDTTQETVESSKVEESSQDSQEKEKEKHRHQSHHKSSSSSRHKSSSSQKPSSRHHHSSSSKSRHDDKYKSRSGKSSSHKKSSGDKEKSSSSRREKDDKKSSSSSKHHKDDHHQEKSVSRRRKSTDHDSNEEKDGNAKHSPKESTKERKSEEVSLKTQENKPVVVDAMLNENMEILIDSKSSKKEKSSILVKYDYLKATSKTAIDIENGFCGFTDGSEKLPENLWFDCLRKDSESVGKPSKNLADQKKADGTLNIQPLKVKAKQKSKSPDLTNGTTEEITPEMRAQTIAQQQRYTSADLYKPRFDFGNRNRRRGQITESQTNDVVDSIQ